MANGLGHVRRGAAKHGTDKARTTDASRSCRPSKDRYESRKKKSGRRVGGSRDHGDRARTTPATGRPNRAFGSMKAVVVVAACSALLIFCNPPEVGRPAGLVQSGPRSVSRVDQQVRKRSSDSSGGRDGDANASKVTLPMNMAAAAASIDGRNEESDRAFIQVWQRLKRHLCPSGSLAPNTGNRTIGRELFRLAREEARKDPAIQRAIPLDVYGQPVPDNVTTYQGRNVRMFDDASIDLFFAGDFDGGTAGVIKTSAVTNVPADSNAESKTTVAHTTSAVVYIRIWKCGNNQIREWYSNNFVSDIASLPVPSHANVSVAFPRNIRRFSTIKSKFGSRRTIVKKKAAAAESFHVDPPCIVTAIRDPIEHFLSGYNEIEYRIISPPVQPKPERRKAIAALPFRQHGRGTVERFKHFLWYILHGTILMRAYVNFKHVFCMSRVLSKLRFFGLQLDGYIPTLHNITYTWPDFVGSTCRRSFPQSVVGGNDSNAVPTLSPLPVGKGQHASSKDPYGTYQAAKDVWREQGPVSRALCVLHAYDYACWESLPDGVPLLCQEVYMSDAFLGIFGESGWRSG